MDGGSDFKKLTYIVVGTIKSKICKVDGKLETLRCEWTPVEVQRQNFFCVKKNLPFVFRVL